MQALFKFEPPLLDPEQPSASFWSTSSYAEWLVRQRTERSPS